MVTFAKTGEDLAKGKGFRTHSRRLKPLTPEREFYLRCHAPFLTRRAIGRHLGVSDQKVLTWLREIGLEGVNRGCPDAEIEHSLEVATWEAFHHDHIRRQRTMGVPEELIYQDSSWTP